MFPFQRPNPLAELMATFAGGGGYSAAPEPAAPGNRLAELEAVLSRPPSYQRATTTAPATKGQRIGAAFADALRTFASMQQGGGPLSTYTDRLADIRERNIQAEEQNRYGAERARAEGERASAMLEYQRLQQEKEAAVRAQELADKRAEDLRQDKVQSSRFIAEQESINARQKNQIQADKELAELRGEIKVKEIQARPVKPATQKPDPNIAKQQKKAEEVMKFIGSAAPSLGAMLARGTQTPDDIRRTLQREMDARGLEGEDRQRVINYFAKHILPILKKHEAAQRTGG